MNAPSDVIESAYGWALEAFDELTIEDAKKTRDQFASDNPEAVDMIEMLDGNLALRELLLGTEKVAQ